MKHSVKHSVTSDPWTLKYLSCVRIVGTVEHTTMCFLRPEGVLVGRVFCPVEWRSLDYRTKYILSFFSERCRRLFPPAILSYGVMPKSYSQINGRLPKPGGRNRTRVVVMSMVRVAVVLVVLGVLVMAMVGKGGESRAGVFRDRYSRYATRPPFFPFCAKWVYKERCHHAISHHTSLNVSV